MTKGSKVARGIGVAFLVGGCCLGTLFLRFLKPARRVPTARAPEVAETPDPAFPPGPVKTLRLAPPPNAQEDDLEKCVAILNRRFERAGIPAHAAISSE